MNGDPAGELPDDLVEHIRQVFVETNSRVTEKLSLNPAGSEPSLDLSWIEQISRHSTPIILSSGWICRIETHCLGSLRHLRNWEIADIGVLVEMRLPNGERRLKVALLQSKRLYPNGVPIFEETRSDYETGFARLADPERVGLSLGLETTFEFSSDSQYPMVARDSDQIAALREYEDTVGLHVYYHLYNPPRVPFSRTVPIAGLAPLVDPPELGVRVVPAHMMHERLEESGNRHPSLRDLNPGANTVPEYGWRLETFICDELLACSEGDQLDPAGDARLRALFFRRTGAISAAISITIEAPDAVPAVAG